MEHAAIIKTLWGDVAVISRDSALSRLLLPGDDLENPEAEVIAVESSGLAQGIAAYFSGKRVNFHVDFITAELNEMRDRVRSSFPPQPEPCCSIQVDVGSLPPFSRLVLAATAGIPYGCTITYGRLSLLAFGDVRRARAIGQVMARNPLPLVIPCHRVLSAHGLGGFSAPGGVEQKARMLAMEAGQIDPLAARN